ncbi:MAG: glycosyltransferase family 4 protein [Chloroflexota bacterium]
MTRTLLFVSAYTGLGGGESVQLNLMGALDRAQWALHLATPREGQLPQAARALGVKTHVVPYRGVPTWFAPPVWRRLPAARRLASLARAIGADAIHTDYHSLPFAVAAAQSNRIPVIWNAMGWWFPVHPWQRGFFRDDITRIVAITEAVRDRWLGPRPFMPRERVRVVVPGVDPAVFHPGVDGSPVRLRLDIGPDAPLAGMIARFQHVKGHDVFQAMARRVLDQMPEARFVVAGENVFGVSKDEAYKQSILQAARDDPALGAALTYLGFWDDAREVIAAADVIVCPSRFESLGMVHLESMAMARPVVSMNNGGPAETVVEGQTGYLVPPDDPDALADRVVRLLRDPALRGRMGEAGRARVLARYTARGYAEQMAALFDEAIGSAR